MKTYKAIFTSAIQAEDKRDAYDQLLDYLVGVAEYGDLTAFEFEEVAPPTEPSGLEIALRAHLAHEGLIDSPVPPCPEGAPYECQSCGKQHTNEFSLSCPDCDSERESGEAL